MNNLSHMTGIFLHTSWRSAGTWAWEALRTQPRTIGFYEPFHEALATLTRRDIEARSASAWPSRHPVQNRPYFAEYEALLRFNGLGVAGASSRFGFDRYMLEEEESHAALRRYTQSLCDRAARRGQRPVFKCVRSQGRLFCLKRSFPAYRHIAVVRHPYAQFTSAWHCLSEGNPYFVATPFLIMERNAAHPAVAALIGALKLPVDPPPVSPIGWRMRRWVRSAATLPAETLYRGVFALWLLNARQALAAPELYDGDQPEALADALGIPHAERPAPITARPLIPGDTLGAIHRTGLAAARPWLGDVAAAIPDWLGRAEADADATCRRAAQTLYPMPQPAALHVPWPTIV
jgi:hypothetical protein